MTTITAKTISKITRSIFEQAAFMMADEFEEGQAPAEDEGAVIRFSGALEGWLYLSASEDVAQEVAANMLGQAEVDSPELKQAAIGELANIICGQVMKSLDDDERVRLETPAWIDAKQTSDDGEESATQWFHVKFDEGDALIGWACKEAA